MGGDAAPGPHRRGWCVRPCGRIQHGTGRRSVMTVRHVAAGAAPPPKGAAGHRRRHAPCGRIRRTVSSRCRSSASMSPDLPPEAREGVAVIVDFAGRPEPCTGATSARAFAIARLAGSDVWTWPKRPISPPSAAARAVAKRTRARAAGTRNRTSVLARPTGVERADATNIPVPIEGADGCLMAAGAGA